MYVIAVLCMIKIYQNRHPDINARAPVTFGMLAVIIFAGLIGVLNGSKSFIVVFSILHLLICFFLTVQIYYMGRCKFNRGVFKRVIQVCISLILPVLTRHIRDIADLAEIQARGTLRDMASTPAALSRKIHNARTSEFM